MYESRYTHLNTPGNANAPIPKSWVSWPRGFRRGHLWLRRHVLHLLQADTTAAAMKQSIAELWVAAFGALSPV